MTPFATKLRALRMSAGLTVEALATRCAIKGLKGSTIKKYEAGVREPSEKTRRILALVLANAALEPLRTTAALLHQNAVGCAMEHYGMDASGGLPGWLADCERDIAAAARALGIADELNGVAS